MSSAVVSCAGISGTVSELEAAGWEVFIGTGGGDRIDLGDRTGPVFVLGHGGADWITTGSGDDAVCAGPGADRIETGAGDDRASGNAGRDTIHTHDGADQVWGGTGMDMIYGGAGDDVLHGNEDFDTLWGEGGNDVCDLGVMGPAPEPTLGCENIIITEG